MEYMIKVETKKIGYHYGTMGWLQRFFSDVTKIEISQTEGDKRPCINLHWIDYRSEIGDREKVELIAFYDTFQNDRYIDYGNSIYGVYPYEKNDYVRGLFSFLTPQSEKVVEKFINECVDILKDYIDGIDKGKEFKISIN